MKILLKNAQVVSSEKIIPADVLIEDGQIVKVADQINIAVDQEYDLTGKYVMPGAIDAHVHFRTPGFEYKEDFRTGSMSALVGGVTTVFDMPNTNPTTTTIEALNQKREIVRQQSLINYKFFFGVTGDNFEEIKQAMNDEDVVGVKFYMGSTTGDMMPENQDVIDRILEQLLNIEGLMVAVHSEDQSIIDRHKDMYKEEHSPEIHSLIRSNDAAFNSTKKAVHLAKKTGGRLHICHMSTKEELELLVKHRDENISSEVAPHHLFFTVKDYAEKGNFLRMNPPIRSNKDVAALWDGISNGAIDIVATDHAPHTVEEKSGDYWDVPSGVPGVATMLPLLLNAVNENKLDITQVAALVCENPARLFGLENKGKIKEGYDADLTVVDMELVKKVEAVHLYSKCGWTPFEGWKLKGWPIMTFVLGRLLMKDGKIL